MFTFRQHSFAGGQLDRDLMGRQDLQKYFSGASVLKNFTVRRQGCISKRRGTNLTAAIDNILPGGAMPDKVRLLPFEFSRQEGYYLLLTAKKAFVMGNEGVLMSDGTFNAKPDAWTIEEDETKEPAEGETQGEGGEGEGEGETSEPIPPHPFYLEIPYEDEELAQLSVYQSGDTLFIAHRNHPVAKIVRSGETDFKFEQIDFNTSNNKFNKEQPIIAAVEKSSNFTGSGAVKNIEYCITAIKNGIESKPSTPYSIGYPTPWPNNSIITVTIANDAKFNDADYFNIYKKSLTEFGLIGSTREQTIYISRIPDYSEPSTALCATWDYVQNSYRKSHRWNFREVDVIQGVNSQNDFECLFITLKDPSMYGDLSQKDSVYFERDFYTGFWIFPNGTLSYTYNTPVFIDEIEIYLGAVFRGIGIMTAADSGLFPNKAKHIVAKAILENGTIITRETSVKPQEYIPIGEYPEHNYNGSNTQFGLNGTQVVTFTFFNSGDDKKKVSQIVITAYTDSTKTTVAKGTCLNDVPDGTPFVINGIISKIQNNSLNFEDDYITPDITQTPPVITSHFDKPGDYPGVVSIHDQRMMLASTKNQPFTFWMSCVGDLYNFNMHSSIREDDAIEATIAATRFPEINHIIDNRDIVLFCENGEWTASAASGNAIAYNTISVKNQSAIGCSKEIAPINVFDEIIFAESNREVLRSIRYNFTSDGYQSQDLSVLANDLFRSNKIVSMAYQQHPDSQIWCALEDGTAAVLTYLPEQEIISWSRIELAAGWKIVTIATNGVISGGTTDLKMIAKRPKSDESEGEGGGFEWRVFSVRNSKDVSYGQTTMPIEDALSIDSLRITDAETARARLEANGDMVAVNLANGAIVKAEDAQTIDGDGEYATGYKFNSEYESVYPDAQGNSALQFEKKNAKSIDLRIERGSDFKCVAHGMNEQRYATHVDLPVAVNDGMVNLCREDRHVPLSGNNTLDGRVRVIADDIYPMTILSLAINYETQPLNGSEG